MTPVWIAVAIAARRAAMAAAQPAPEVQARRTSAFEATTVCAKEGAASAAARAIEETIRFMSLILVITLAKPP
jgi:hypothetical protein